MKKDNSKYALKWSEKIEQQKLSGKNVAQWCKENGVSYQSFLNWRQRLTKEMCSKHPLSKSSFFELPKNEYESWLRISCKGMRISINKGVDKATLQKCLDLFRDL